MRGSGLRLKADPDLPIQELLARFELGDYLGALAVADSLLEDGRRPVVLLSSEQLQTIPLDPREEFLISLLDHGTSLEALLESTGWPVIDALRVFCELAEKEIMALI